MPGHSPPNTAKVIPTYSPASAALYSTSLAYYPALAQDNLAESLAQLPIGPSSSVPFSYDPGDISIDGTRLALLPPRGLVTKSVAYDSDVYHRYEESLAITTITRHL